MPPTYGFINTKETPSISPGSAAPPISTGSSISPRGAKGARVRWVQRKLKIDADGDFGLATHEAVIAFQRAHPLPPDGIVGPKPFAGLCWAT